jgi:hypothetical protein
MFAQLRGKEGVPGTVSVGHRPEPGLDPRPPTVVLLRNVKG